MSAKRTRPKSSGTRKFGSAGVCWVLLDERTGERFGRFEWAPNAHAAEAYANVLDERMGRPGGPVRLLHVFVVPNVAKRHGKAA